MPLGPSPVAAFNFLVFLVETGGRLRTVAGFQECSGLESALEVEEYREGGRNDRIHKFPTRFTFTNLVLKRGVSLDPALRAWHQALLAGETQRRDGLVVLQNESKVPVVAWKFERGLPVKWTGPTLNATASETAIETLEISYEKLEPFDLGRIA